jgi:hypothetical protein
VDASPAYFFGHSSSLNGLREVNLIDNYPLSQDVPGNALNKNKGTNHNHLLSMNNIGIDDYPSNAMVDSVSVNSYLSIDTYPLIEDKDPPKVGTVPLAIKMLNKK